MRNGVFGAAILIVLVVFGRAAFATPEDDLIVLKAQAKALEAEVAVLRAQVAELEARLAELQAAAEPGGTKMVPAPVEPVRPPVAAPPVKPVPPVAPPVPVPPVPVPPTPVPPVPPLVVPGAGAAGTWTLDVAATAEIELKARLEAIESEMEDATEEEKDAAREEARQEIEGRTESLGMTLVLAADGTFKADATFGEETHTAQGTWKLDGEKLTLVTTHENGVEKTEHEELNGSVRGDRLALGTSDDGSEDIIFVRQS